MSMNDSPKTVGDQWDVVPVQAREEVLELSDDILKVVQNLDISLHAKKKNNILIIQNVNIIDPNAPELQVGKVETINAPEPVVRLPAVEKDIYTLILGEIERSGGFDAFKLELGRKVVEMCNGNKTHAAKKLGVSVRTIRNWLNLK